MLFFCFVSRLFIWTSKNAADSVETRVLPKRRPSSKLPMEKKRSMDVVGYTSMAPSVRWAIAQWKQVAYW